MNKYDMKMQVMKISAPTYKNQYHSIVYYKEFSNLKNHREYDKIRDVARSGLTLLFLNNYCLQEDVVFLRQVGLSISLW